MRVSVKPCEAHVEITLPKCKVVMRMLIIYTVRFFIYKCKPQSLHKEQSGWNTNQQNQRQLKVRLNICPKFSPAPGFHLVQQKIRDAIRQPVNSSLIFRVDVLLLQHRVRAAWGLF